MKALKVMLCGIMLVVAAIFCLLCSVVIPAVVLALVGLAVFILGLMTKSGD